VITGTMHIEDSKAMKHLQRNFKLWIRAGDDAAMVCTTSPLERGPINSFMLYGVVALAARDQTFQKAPS
jgi:hypothetical protein